MSLRHLYKYRTSWNSPSLGTSHAARPYLVPFTDIVLPRYFPYLITVSSLGVVFIGIIYWLIAQRRLLPAIVMIGAFMLFVLWLVGLVMIGMQLFGPDNSIQSVCDIQVFNRNPKGQTEETMAWLQQRNICTCLTALPVWVMF